MNLQTLTDEQLKTSTRQSIAVERRATLMVIAHFEEIERRKLYAKEGKDSLHTYVTRVMGYSEGSAGRIINAMFLAKDVPEVKAKLANQELSLEQASMIQSFARQQRKKGKPLNKREFIDEASNKTIAQTKDMMVAIDPERLPQESVRKITPTHSVATIVFDEEATQLLEECKNLLSNTDPTMPLGEIIKRALKLAAKEWNPATPKRKHQRKAPPKGIPAHIERAVWQRDEGMCAWVNSMTGERCCSKHRVETDHIIPQAMGGTHEIENLRLACRTHNQYWARVTYGEKHISQWQRQ